MHSHRLQIKIILALALFIGSGMLLIDVVLTVSSQKRLLTVEMDKAQVVVTLLAGRLGQEKKMSPVLSEELAALAHQAGLDLVVLDDQGQARFHSRPESSARRDLAEVTRRAVLSEVMTKGTSGSSFGLLGRRHDYFLTAMPVPLGQELAGVGVELALAPLYQELLAGQRLIAIYFALNLAVLTFFAYHRLAGLLIKPLQLLARRAEEYQDEASFYFLSDRRGDDVSALSTSLNRMLRRINTDRRKLQEMVMALEEANVSLIRAQQEVIQAEKLASVGRLSAGIAHEIGNPVGIVLGYLELLQQENLEPGDRLDFIRRAIEEINRINTIIRQLLDLARSGDDEQGRVHLHELLTDMHHRLKDQPLLAAMTIVLDLRADHDAVEAIADKLRQVFLNIIMNAADAVQGNGAEPAGLLTIATATGTASLQPGQAEVPVLKISCTDNGPGIATENVETLFDPFFTTKEPGKGTGLGLSVSYMIIDNAKGKITAARRPQGGTVFTVLLPLAAAETNKHPHGEK
ncbi:MAG: ATP-binding protein [Desulfurivibrionaceae bacterium]|nr:ATP-binding protein [Desulfurivibrionaceae bacterium]